MQKQQYRFFFITFSIIVSVFFFLQNKMYPPNHTEVFDTEIQPHEMVKSYCESEVAL